MKLLESAQPLLGLAARVQKPVRKKKSQINYYDNFSERKVHQTIFDQY